MCVGGFLKSQLSELIIIRWNFINHESGEFNADLFSTTNNMFWERAATLTALFGAPNFPTLHLTTGRLIGASCFVQWWDCWCCSASGFFWFLLSERLQSWMAGYKLYNEVLYNAVSAPWSFRLLVSRADCSNSVQVRELGSNLSSCFQQSLDHDRGFQDSMDNKI